MHWLYSLTAYEKQQLASSRQMYIACAGEQCWWFKGQARYSACEGKAQCSQWPNSNGYRWFRWHCHYHRPSLDKTSSCLSERHSVLICLNMCMQPCKATQYVKTGRTGKTVQNSAVCSEVEAVAELQKTLRLKQACFGV